MYSKTTEHFQLPQWVIPDHPDFLTDVNIAFQKIDSNLYSAVSNAEYAKNAVDTFTPIVNKLVSDVQKNTQTINSQGVEIGNLKSQQNTNTSDIGILKEHMDLVRTSLGKYFDSGSTVESAITDLQNTLIGFTPTNTVHTVIHDIENRVSNVENFSNAREMKSGTLGLTSITLSDGVTCDNSGAFTLALNVVGNFLVFALNCNGICNIKNTVGTVGNINNVVKLLFDAEKIVDGLTADNVMMDKISNVQYSDLTGNIYSILARVRLSGSNIEITLIPTPNINYSFANQKIWMPELLVYYPSLSE